MDMGTRLVRITDVMNATGLSRSSLYLAMSEGTFPAALKIGKRSIAWEESAVREWVAGRIAAHRKSQAA